MNEDLISREDAIKAIEKNFLDPSFVHDAISTIRELPSAQRKGQWMLMRVNDDGHGNVTFQCLCSKCGEPAHEFFQPYCHHCGAYMKGESYDD